jgi:hypothetical protein
VQIRLLLFALALLFGALPVQAQRLALITAEEASLPPRAMKTKRAITRGPEVRLDSPNTAVKAGVPFRLHIVVRPRGGVPIDAASVQIRYMREPVVDLMPRLRAHTSAGGVLIDEAVAPAGDHDIEVLVRDAQDRVTAQVLRVTVQ